MQADDYYKPPGTDPPPPAPPRSPPPVTAALIGGRILQVLGSVVVFVGATFLLFSCSPANTADAQALLWGGLRTVAVGLATGLVGTLLARRKSG